MIYLVRIISIANQKGGVGKTTTSINLSACLAEAGQRVLVIDMDPQGNTTTGLGIDKMAEHRTIYDVLLGDSNLPESVIQTEFGSLWVIPSTVNLAGAEIELISHTRREFILKTALDAVKDAYDFIIIDCPPSLNILTINALVASDSVLVPIQCEYYALEGLSQLLHTVNLVKERLNKSLHIEGIAFTMYDPRTNLSLQVVEEVKNYLKGDIYKAIIPRNVRLGEAPSHGLPITEYDPKSKGAEGYRTLAELVIARGEE